MILIYGIRGHVIVIVTIVGVIIITVLNVQYY